MINGLMTLSGAWDQAAHRPGGAPARGLRRLLRHVDLRRPGDVDQGGQRAVATTPTGPSATCTPARWAGSAWSRSAPSTAWSPGCWKRRGLYSHALVEWHFWIATIGMVLYISSMWVSGIMQGLMWRAYDPHGFLTYSFIETVQAKH